MNTDPRWLLIGNAGNRRVAYAQDALRHTRHAPAKLLSWIDVLTGRVDVRDHMTPDTILRLESPGEDERVSRALLALGATRMEAPTLSVEQAASAELERGRLLAPRQLREGWQAALESLAADLDGAPGRIMSHPDEIAVMFDKLATHHRLDANQVPRIPSIEGVGDYEALRAAMAQAGWDRVFIKLRGSSSASGVAALRTSGPRVMLTTTAHLIDAPDEPDGFKLFNALKPRRYAEEAQCARVINWLLGQGAVIERWLPKAALGDGGDGGNKDKNFDLRVVVIRGRAHQIVVRSSEHPMTNLHLGNARGDLDAMRALIGASGLAALDTLCAQVGAAFPRAHYLGADVLIPEHDHASPVIIEANAFGDLLPNVMVEGDDSYTAEVRAFVPVGDVPPAPPIRAVLFDLDNTLIDRDAAFRAAVIDWTGCDEDALERVFALDAHGHGDRQTLCEALCGLLNEDVSAWHNVWAELPHRIAQQLQPDPTVQAMLERLSTRYKLAILSNGGAAGQRDKLARADLARHFDPHAIFISDEIGATKPDAAIFEAALAACGCSDDPRAAVMVGDTPMHDLLGARSAGLYTAWMARGRQWHPAQPAPDVTLNHDVTEIEAWLHHR
jgi:HAD superfamily hydrolase (TIGR01549 family)